MRRRRHNAVPKTRSERAVEIRKYDPSLSATLTRIDIALRNLNPAIERAVDACRASSSGSVVGSVVQVPRQDPRHQQAIDWLDAVVRSVEDVVREGRSLGLVR